MKDLLLPLLALLGGFAWVFFNKKKDEQVLKDNEKVMEQVLEDNKKITENNTALKTEEVTRNQLLEDMKKEQDEEVNSADVLDFFNKRQ